MSPVTAPNIPIANAGPVTDYALKQVAALGDDLQAERHLTEAELVLLVMTVPQIARELLQRRHSMETIANLTEIDNVTFLDQVRDNG